MASGRELHARFRGLRLRSVRRRGHDDFRRALCHILEPGQGGLVAGLHIIGHLHAESGRQVVAGHVADESPQGLGHARRGVQRHGQAHGQVAVRLAAGLVQGRGHALHVIGRGLVAFPLIIRLRPVIREHGRAAGVQGIAFRQRGQPDQLLQAETGRHVRRAGIVRPKALRRSVPVRAQRATGIDSSACREGVRHGCPRSCGLRAGRRAAFPRRGSPWGFPA